MQLAKRSQNTLTAWTHFQKPYRLCSLPEEARTHSLAGHIFRKEAHQACSLPEEARTHSHPGHILRRSLIRHAACQKSEHTHSLDTFPEETLSGMQLARRSQNILTYWTHFQKKPHQQGSLPEEDRAHSLAGHIFRRSLISHTACQKKPEHTHSLDTVSKGALSAIQLARRSQNTLTSWIHFQKEPYQPSSLQECQNTLTAWTHFQEPHQMCNLPEEARTHSHTGHIFRRSLFSYAACKKMPEHTHILDRFSEGASSAMQLTRRSQNTLTIWTHFQKEPQKPCSFPEEARTHSLAGHIFRMSLISHAACQKKPEQTHLLDTLAHQPYTLPEEARTHSLAGHNFGRSLITHTACQKKPEHTHSLDTFSEGASSAMQLGRRSQNTLTPWTHLQMEPS